MRWAQLKALINGYERALHIYATYINAYMQDVYMIREAYLMRKRAKEQKSKTLMKTSNTCLEQILYVDNQIEGYQLFYILISL